MNQDLLMIMELWSTIQQIRELEREQTLNTNLVFEFTNTLENKEKELFSIQKTFDKITKDLTDLVKKAESHRIRAEKTQEMIDLGKAPNFALAHKQVLSCQQLSHEWEEQAFEMMELQEAQKELLSIKAQELTTFKSTFSSIKQKQAIRKVEIDESLELNRKKRSDLESVIPREYYELINAQISRQKPLIGVMKNGMCRNCNRSVNNTDRTSIERGERAKTCTYCGVFLVPE